MTPRTPKKKRTRRKSVPFWGGAEPGLGTLWNRFLGTVHPAGPIPSFGGSASDRCLDRFSTTRRPADPGLGLVESFRRTGPATSRAIPFRALGAFFHPRDHEAEEEAAALDEAGTLGFKTHQRLRIGDSRKQIGSHATCMPRNQLRLPSPALSRVPFDVESSTCGP